MYLIVNEVELSVNNAYVERNVITNTLSAIIKIPYDSMGFDELKTLFMNNTGTITKTNDDGTTESWDSFKYDKPPVDDGTQYGIILVGEEAAYQIERLRHMEKVIAENATTIEQKNVVISEKETTITEQAETITALETAIAEKDTEITEKDVEIAELLTIAEEYADMVFASLGSDVALEESEVE